MVSCTPSRWVLIALITIAVSGCAIAGGPDDDADASVGPTPLTDGGSAAGSTSIPKGDAHEGSSSEPFTAAVEARIGYSVDELHEVAGQMRVGFVDRCMSAKGFDITRSEIELLVLDEYAETTTLLDIAVAQVTGEPVPGALPSDIPEEQIIPCIEQAEAETSSVQRLSDLLGEIIEDISARIGSNSEFLQARDLYEECIGSLGFDSAPRAGQTSDERASEIMGQYLGGSLSKNEAILSLQDLRDLQANEFSNQAEVDKCAGPLLAVEERIYAQEQRRMLDENPGLLDGIAEEYASLNSDVIAVADSG